LQGLFHDVKNDRIEMQIQVCRDAMHGFSTTNNNLPLRCKRRQYGLWKESRFNQ